MVRMLPCHGKGQGFESPQNRKKNKMKNKEEDKLVLCGFCQKPIHVSEFGGVKKVGNKAMFFHSNCFVENEKVKIENEK